METDDLIGTNSVDRDDDDSKENLKNVSKRLLDVESGCDDKNSFKGMNVDEQEERQHFMHILNTFRAYKKHSLQRLDRTSRYLNTLKQDHQEKLQAYKQHLVNLRVAIEYNYEVIKEMIGDVENMFENIDYSTSKLDKNKICKPSSMDIEKVHSILKQVVREWTEEGARERASCFNPILQQIDEIFGCVENKPKIKVLVPGAGLGRLAFEIARRGFACQGNEYSLYMLFISNFILNKCKDVNIISFFPWVHQYHNNLTSSDQLLRLSFPDVNPSDLPENIDFSMAAGNFVEIYNEPDNWDCVATCFFIDTANNVVAYIETIWKILKPGGFWINLGPLLYHYADLPNEESIEPSYEIVKQAILAFGFEMIKEQTDVASYYTQNPKSMLAYEYHSVFFVCRKPQS